MKIEYFPDTDSMYIDLSERSSADSVEVSDGVVIDYDSAGNIVGIVMTINVVFVDFLRYKFRQK